MNRSNDGGVREISRALVVGAGSIGRRHLSNLIDLGVPEVAVVDLSAERLQGLSERVVATWGEVERGLAWEPEAVLICTPNRLHVQGALAAAMAGAAVFIEKPVSDRIDSQLDHLVNVVEERGTPVMVACNMRYHPGVAFIREAMETGAVGKPLHIRARFGHYLPNWRPTQDYRETYSARDEEGGGIILDAIHEIDSVRWIAGEIDHASGSAARVSELEINVEDTADLHLRFENGATGALHLDYLDRIKRRGLEVIGSTGTAVWRSVGKRPERAVMQLYDERGQCTEHEAEVDINAPYLEMLEEFLSIAGGGPRRAGLDLVGAISDLRVAQAARASVSR